MQSIERSAGLLERKRERIGREPVAQDHGGDAEGVEPAGVALAVVGGVFVEASTRQDQAIAKDLRPVYTAANEADALDKFAESPRSGRPAAFSRLNRLGWLSLHAVNT